MKLAPVSAILTLGCLLLLGGCANGSEQAEDTDNAKNKTCTLSAETGEQACFTSFEQALAAVTGGKIADAPASAKEAIQDDNLAQRINALSAGGDQVASAEMKLTQTVGSGSYPIAVFYENDLFNHNSSDGGSSLIVWGSHPCDAATWPPEYTISYIGDNMNDDTTSYRGYSNCRIRLFMDAGPSGENWSFKAEEANVGDYWNDKASAAEIT